MADIVTLNVKNTTSTGLTMSAGAAAATIPLDYSDNHAVLLVNNRNTDVIVRANIEAGDGIRSCLGDLDVNIAVSTAAAIPLSDSMRFVVATTQNVTLNLRDTADTALTATPLALIDCVLIQG
jgi:hypothetical protein